MVAYIKRLPDYFFSCTHPKRWRDEYASPDGEERMILTPEEIIQKGRRNDAYLRWMQSFSNAGITPRQPRWQVIQIMKYKHAESNVRDWWEKYQDCLFRVYVQPQTLYYRNNEWRQWYVLSYEDCELINRYELELIGPTLPPRDPLREPFVSNDKRLRRMKLIPADECSRHWRHETTAGKLPEGL